VNDDRRNDHQLDDDTELFDPPAEPDSHAEAPPAPPSPARRMAVVVASLAVLGLLAWASFAVLSRGSDESASALLGLPVPPLSLADAESGEVFQLAAPGKVLVVNFWAPWCIPCRPEHEMLNRVALDLSPDEVTIVGITYQSEPDDVRSFLDEVGRNIRSFADADGRAAIEFGVTGVPETFVVDASGIVRRHVVGPLDDGQLERLVTEVEQLAPAGSAA
jgi:cytochrome c biogenesis protein CcmG/thiol:disulfide interchange protein DsbE